MVRLGKNTTSKILTKLQILKRISKKKEKSLNPRILKIKKTKILEIKKKKKSL